ncbi:MAG: class I SAM-dependent methyltransferase [Aggregatilineales bacterium]
MKSTVEQIRERFDKDVDRFSNLETGQSATIDSPLCLELIARAAAASAPHATDILDIGCGAGNYTLKLLELLPNRNTTLIDLSRPMLDRAVERIHAVSSGSITPLQTDIRKIDLGKARYDIILAASVLHHLRNDHEWQAVFVNLYRALRPGGSIWIFDLITHLSKAIQDIMWERYGEYLVQFKGEAYREQVFNYVEQEDTPRPLMFQVDLLRGVGFQNVEILHKNSCFAAFGGIK